MYPQIFGKYVLERELARGGMARVLLATLRGAGGFEKRLVVKQIRDELAHESSFVHRFVQEAKTTVALSHPNIVPVYELGVEAGTYFLAMELVEGVSVAELMRGTRDGPSRGVLSAEEGAYLAVEVCRALDYAHRRMNVVHRDITPRNVMIDEEGQVRLIDFGIAAPSRVAGHEVLGSPGHMAPEQIEGGALGPATDVFALAVLLVEAWSGKPVFRRSTDEETRAAMAAPRARPSDANAKLASLDDIVERCLARDPKQRPQTAGEVGRTMRRFLQDADISDIARGLGERVRDLRERAAVRRAEAPSSDRKPRASSASHSDYATKTFATRGDLASLPPPPPPPDSEVEIDAPSTRRMDSVTPPPPSPELAVGPLPSRPSLPPETIATRPIATDASLAAEPKRAGRGARAIALLVVALLAGAALAVGIAKPGEAHRERGPAPLVAASAEAPVAPSSPRSPSTPADVAPAAAADARARGASTAPQLTPTAQARASAAAAVAEKALVSFVADPSGTVLVDGRPRGACPLKLQLSAGTHEVRFLFDATGESRGERIRVEPGDRVVVRADFTGATPTVKVQR